MFRRSIAALFVALWLILLGIEFSEDMGFIDYEEPEMDRSVEATLASLGEAITISDDLQLVIPSSVFASPVAYFPVPDSQEVFIELVREISDFVKPDMPLYHLHQVFLI